MNDVLAYFLDKDTFEIKECTQIKIKEINLDLETNGNSSFTSIKKLDIEENDFVYIKDEGFFGIVKNQSDDGKNGLYNLSCKNALAMLDFESFDSFNEQPELIKEVGIEDFLVNRISQEFITNSDSMCNKPYFSVEALTHTPKLISIQNLVTVQNQIYNFLTLVGNIIEYYGIKFEFIIDNGTLKLEISENTDETMLIDTTISDVVDYEETFAISYIAKVECLDTNNERKYYRYLLNDRTITDDATNPNRVTGKTKRITVNQTDEVLQSMTDVFKGNSYQHNITFKINKNSKLIDVANLKLGTPIKIKTNNNVVNDTYISKIKKTNNKFIEFTCGNMRVDFIDKFLKERRGR